MQKDSNNEADSPRQNAGSIYLSALYEPLVFPFAQKRTGLVLLRPINAIRRKRIASVSPPIRRKWPGLGCG